jgi:formate hydrogenlyase transcriptional activator
VVAERISSHNLRKAKGVEMSTQFASATAFHEATHQFSLADNVLSIRTRRRIPGSRADADHALTFEERPMDRSKGTAAQLKVDQIRDEMNFDQIVGNSPALTDVLELIKKVASWDSTVLLLGETGTGKELVAQAIHRHSARSHRPLVKVNCAALPSELVASELFGHEKGAFTGAMQQRIGRFEAANGGTIFLDEIAELSPEIQVALLRVLQEREFERVGGNRTIKTDVRVIAATNKDLRHEVSAGRFRMDLFYRLNVFPIRVPALRERLEDIPLLVDYFAGRLTRRMGKKITHVERQSLSAMQQYSWPGNVRELQNIIERAVILTDGEVLRVDPSTLAHEPPLCISAPAFAGSGSRGSDRKSQIETALRETRGKVYGPNGAAARLHIAGTTLDSQILALGIKKYQFK